MRVTIASYSTVIKFLASYWLDYMGTGGRSTVNFDVPAEGASGSVPDSWYPISLGKAVTRRKGDDIMLVSVAVGAHSCMESAVVLEDKVLPNTKHIVNAAQKLMER